MTLAHTPASHDTQSDKKDGTSRRDLLKAAGWATSLAAASVPAFPALAETPTVNSTDLTAREAVDRISKGEMTAEAYVTDLLKHHAAHKDLNAFITLDENRVKQEARAVDLARKRGDKLGRLAGLPVVVKDQIDVTGYPTTVGSTVLKGYVAKKNAVVIDTMIKAGAVVMAKTNMSDLITGGRYYPAARNPYDLSRTTGGSSTGVGAALGARIAPAGIGEDTAGSVRWPAANCGVVGLRPSTFAFDNYFNGTDKKRYSGLGMVLPTTWMDTMGPMARTVSDVAFLDGVITGEKLQAVSLRTAKIGIPRGDYWDKRPHDPQVKQVIDTAIAKLKDAGLQTVEIDLNALIELSARDRLGPMVTKGARSTADWLAENQPLVTEKDIDAERARNGFSTPPRNYFRIPAGSQARPQITPAEEAAIMKDAWAKYSGAFKDNGIVALASPTMMMLPPYLNLNWNPRDQKIKVGGQWVEEWDLILTNIWWGSRFGAPALSLPAGMAEGLPVGMQLQGMPGTDTQVLALGMAAEKVLGSLPPPTFKHVPI
jgi:Asp-tRNA(Asn)/Glu-tRNA(Gln) amidotransferase A subunit family amidase